MATPWFDYRHTSDHRHTHNIYEHRAPTDESVRLLKEFEEAARKKIDSEVRLKDCPLDVVVHTAHDRCAGTIHVVLLYSLGGERKSIRVEVPTAHSERELGNVAETLRAALVADLSRHILGRCFAEVVQAVQG